MDGERLRVDELQVALGEVESERDSLLDMKDKIELTQRKLSEVEEREILLLKDIDDIKGKHAFAQAEFEKERDELNDVVTKSKLLLQVRFFHIFINHFFHILFFRKKSTSLAYKNVPTTDFCQKTASSILTNVPS